MRRELREIGVRRIQHHTTQSRPDARFGRGEALVIQCRSSTCVEIKILRRVRAESSRRPPRHRCDACSMAWRCRFLAARRDQRGRVIAIPDTLVDFHTDRHVRASHTTFTNLAFLIAASPSEAAPTKKSCSLDRGFAASTALTAVLDGAAEPTMNTY